MNRKETVDTLLNQAKIDPAFTELGGSSLFLYCSLHFATIMRAGSWCLLSKNHSMDLIGKVWCFLGFLWRPWSYRMNYRVNRSVWTRLLLHGDTDSKIYYIMMIWWNMKRLLLMFFSLNARYCFPCQSPCFLYCHISFFITTLIIYYVCFKMCLACRISSSWWLWSMCLMCLREVNLTSWSLFQCGKGLKNRTMSFSGFIIRGCWWRTKLWDSMPCLRYRWS